MENKKKPAIRFKGFCDDWEQRKLPEFVSFFNGLTYTPDDVQETGTLVLRSSNVKNGEIVDADNVYVSDKVVTSENVQEGDIIVVVRNGSRALIGKHAQIKASMPNTVIGAFMSGIRSGHYSFINALLDTSAFENEIAKNMGATINQITGYMFSKMEFMIPSEEEQQRIGEYFSNLDHLITLHQRKCNKLQLIKKSMLEKMFPQNSQNIPEVRFKGFTDAWEQRKVAEIGNIITGSTPKTSISDNYGGEFLFVSPADIQGNRYVDETITTLTKKGFDQGRKIRERASLFVSIGSTIGKVAQTSQESTTNQQINAVEPYDNFDDDFIFTSLENISGSIKAIATNQAVPIVNKTTFGETEIQVPSELAEQQRIGAYFRNLDHLITLHQRELEKLQIIKKSMLEKMFV